MSIRKEAIRDKFPKIPEELWILVPTHILVELLSVPGSEEFGAFEVIEWNKKQNSILKNIDDIM